MLEIGILSSRFLTVHHQRNHRPTDVSIWREIIESIRTAMSTVLVSNALITGGTFTQVNNNDGLHDYHRFRGAFTVKILLCKTHVLIYRELRHPLPRNSYCRIS